MSNPFHQTVDDVLRGHRVHVIDQEGRQYEGVLDRRNHHDDQLLLRGATHPDEDDEDAGPLWIDDPVVVRGAASERVEHVPLEEVHPSPYHAREFDAGDNASYIQQVAAREYAGSLPIVRVVSDGMQVVDGHKRAWIAQQAGLQSHAMRVVDWDDWRAAQHYAASHLPQANDEDAYQILEALADRWGTEAHDLPHVQRELDARDRVELTDEGLQDVEPPSTEQSEPEDGPGDEAADGAEDDVESLVTPESDVSVLEAAGATTASRLRNAGYETVADIAWADEDDLTDISYIGQTRATDLLSDADAVVDEHHDSDDSPNQADDEDTSISSEEVLDVVDQHDGRVDQDVLVEQSHAAKATVSTKLQTLEEGGEVVVVDIGRGNLVCRPDEVPDAAADAHDAPEEAMAADGQGSPAYVEHDIDPNDLVDALDGATSATDVQHALDEPDTDVVSAVIEDLGLGDDLASTGSMDRRTAEAAVREVAPDA